VLSNTPTLVTPNIGAATGTSVNLSGAGTFGGNLTVSGTGTSSFAGVVTATGNGTFGGNSLAGNRILTVSNTATAHGAWASMAVDTSVSGLKLAHLSSGWSGTFLTGGPTTTQSAIYTTSSAPIVFGVNSTYVGKAESTGWTLAGNITVSGTDKSILLNGASTAFSREIDVRIAGDTEGRLLIRGGGSLLFGDGAGTFDSAIARSSASMLTVTGSLTTSGNLTVSGTGNNIFNSGGGNVLIGTTTDGGQRLQVNGTATFAGDVTISASTGTYYGGTSTGAGGFSNNNASAYLLAYGSSNVTYPSQLQFNAGGAVALRIDGSQNATFAGNIKTAAPSGGTAGAWKLGVRVAATTTLDTTQYLQVDIGGTLYKVALVTS
jgi:hypothetical protein